MKRTTNNLFFNTIQCICFLFWGIPEIFQKPFKILLILFLFYISLNYVLKGKKLQNIILPLIGATLLLFSVFYSNFQTSVINIALSLFCIPCVSLFAKSFTEYQKRKARKIAFFLCLCMILQLCIFRSNDGRPTLGYEINWSAAYLFIFYIYSDYIEFKLGKIFVIIASLLLLSRLLVLSLIILIVLKRLITRFKITFKLNLYLVELVTFIAFFSFNLYFINSLKDVISYDTSINRLNSVKDGSNKIRFTINLNIIQGLSDDDKLKYGYGQIAKPNGSLLYKQYTNKYFLMPHNELLDAIAEFGYIFTIFSWIFSTFFYSKVFKYYNYPYIISILIYTLILWARFLIIPSIEMFFLLSLLTIRQNESIPNNILSK